MVNVLLLMNCMVSDCIIENLSDPLIMQKTTLHLICSSQHKFMAISDISRGTIFAETCVDIFPLTLRVGQAEGLACADPVARTPHRRERKFFFFSTGT